MTKEPGDVGDRSPLPVHPDETDQIDRRAALEARFLAEVETSRTAMFCSPPAGNGRAVSSL
jgi:hypothetical protein